MRDYVLNQAEILGRGASLGRFQRLFRNWRARRQIAALLDQEDRILDDIGLTRAEIEHVLSQPIDLDPGRELDRVTLTRQHQRVAAYGASRG